VPLPFPPHVAKNVKEARALYDLVTERGQRGFAGVVQGEAALAALEHGRGGAKDPYDRPDAAPRPYLPGEEPEPVVAGEAPAR
jgi:hypothetical protein